MPVSSDLRDRVFAWVADDPEQATAAEALALIVKEDEAALQDRFAARLEFGTAGLRGLLGAGPNRMNRAVVRRTTAGLCSYLFKQVPHSHARGIVIGRDGREGSDRFALDAARVAMGMGFVVHYFNEVVPTPVLAFAVRDLGAAAGVMVTASHNPPEYNGYKVYWQNAAQIIPPHDIGIAEAIDAIQSVKSLSLLDPEAGRTLGLFRTVSRDVLNHYYGALSALRFTRPADQSLSIAYTPMHGVGGPFVKRALEEGGFANVFVVPEQEKPDPAFPTVRFPNPEEKGAMDKVLALAEAKKAELVLANDPDADRLAVAYRNRDGKYVQLSGNELGVILGHHRLVDDPKTESNRLVLASLVSSPQLGAIAKELGVRYGETLTGFKWIANTAIALEASDQAKFVFGFEEALGYTVSTIVRDKDGVSAALVAAQLAAMLKAKGQTLGDRLDEIAQQFGVYSSEQHSATYPGLTGAATIQKMMAYLRANTPWNIGGTAVAALRDYDKGQTLTAGGGATKLDSPASNVLAFDLEGDARIIARPSGTEPKIKFYFDVRTKLATGETLAQARARGVQRVAELKKAFVAITDAAAR